MTERREVREAEVAHPDCRSSKVKLEDDMWVEAGFEEAADALSKPVRIRHVHWV